MANRSIGRTASDAMALMEHLSITTELFRWLELAEDLRSAWPTDSEEQKKRVKVFYLEELVPHFELEEKYVFPMARGAFPESEEVLDRLLRQHRKIAIMVEEIDSESGSRLLKELGKLLERHIRLEERTLFEKMQKFLAEERLQEIEKAIPASHREGRS